MTRRAASVFALATLCSAPLAQAKITLDLDYSLDANGFFNPATTNGAAARAALSAAADVFNDRFLDTLTAVSSGGQNTFTAIIRHPATGNTEHPVSGLSFVAANTIKVYAGGRDEPGDTAGVGGPGGWTGSATSQAYFDNLESRGNPGALASAPTDFAPFTGSIGFDTLATWNYDLAGPVSGKNDFYSVALHELAHLMGFGTADSFENTYTVTVGSAFQFTGPKSKALNGGANVPLADDAHLASSLLSTVTGTGTQQPAMSPAIQVGTRKRLTLLDWAGLDDLGWSLAKPGDANADAAIGFDDLLLLAQNYGGGGKTWSDGDFNYDNAVNFDDLLALAQNYGGGGPLLSDPAMSGLASSSFAADWALAQSLVPEPTSLVALAGVLPLAMRRRR